MSKDQLFYLNLTIGGFLLAYFVLGRTKQKPPTKLNLRASAGSPVQNQQKSLTSAADYNNSGAVNPAAELKQSLLEPEIVTDLPSAKKYSKQLSIFFMYNGHDWEAHEVLGIPQGASVDVATKAYQQQLKSADASSYEFLESAYNAIFKKQRNQRL